MKLREVNKEMGNMVRKVCTAKSTASTGDTESLEIIEKENRGGSNNLREIFTENQEDELQIVVAQKSIEKDEIEEISTPTISKYASHLRDLDAETNTTTAEIKDSPAKLINESSHFNEINDCEVSAAKEEVLNRLIMENLCIIRENLASAEFIKKDDVDFSKAFLKYMKTSGNAYEYKKVANSQSNISNTEWRTTTPIYVADGSRSTHPVFPQRRRGTFCYVCGDDEDNLIKCSASSCSTKFHEKCLHKYTGGGYALKFMSRNEKLYCPRHHCNACFADHNRVRCFAGPLVQCSQCELAWHNDDDCIPGGCTVNQKGEIVCPRHVIFPDAPSLHATHCSDCQAKFDEGLIGMVRCNSCFRSLHFDCLNEALRLGLENTLDFRKIAVCNWCHKFDYARYGEYAMGRLSNNKWYPCKIVKNEKYPNKNDPLVGAPGYMVVEWLPFRGKVTYNLLTHNRVITMSPNDFFFVSEAHKSDIYEEWKSAQTYMLDRLKRFPKSEQMDCHLSNGERVKMIKSNRYTSQSLKSNSKGRGHFERAGLCNCDNNAKNRCGPKSNCVNRQLSQECPKECTESPQGCDNRNISDGKNCLSVEIKYFPGKGFGAITLVKIAQGGFVGEYVGEVIDNEQKQRRVDRIRALESNEAQFYIMDMDNSRSIDAHYFGNEMRYVNHSCDPNCVVEVITSDSDTHLALIALKDIETGDELSFDYNMYSNAASGRVLPPVCRCGSAKCTGTWSATTKRQQSQEKDIRKTPVDKKKKNSKTKASARKSSKSAGSVSKQKMVAENDVDLSSKNEEDEEDSCQNSNHLSANKNSPGELFGSPQKKNEPPAKTIKIRNNSTKSPKHKFPQKPPFSSPIGKFAIIGRKVSLPNSSEENVSGLKRGRGRPRKEAVSHPPRSKSIEVDGQITSFLAALDTNTTLLQNNNKENDDDGITPTSSKRGRGRPRKEVLLRESKSSFVGVSPPHPLAAKEEQKIDARILGGTNSKKDVPSGKRKLLLTCEEIPSISRVAERKSVRRSGSSLLFSA